MVSVLKYADFRGLGLEVYDVRTPAEFEKGHIPGAINLPLFTNDERVEVGTLYKTEGRQAAILRGLELVGPKLSKFVTVPQNKQIAVHCWRGGMRSQSVGWLLDMYGFDVTILDGGYKAFRNWVLDSFNELPRIEVVGGLTGVGKTEVLTELALNGEHVVDLEGIANHRGSAFGAMPGGQPTQQNFENTLAVTFASLPEPVDRVWVEDEAPMIGTLRIPKPLVDGIRDAPLWVLECELETRLQRLVEMYSDQPPEELTETFERISKRLGSERVVAALKSIEERDWKNAASIALDYYDRAYRFGVSKRHPDALHPIQSLETVTETTQRLLHEVDKHYDKPNSTHTI